MEGIMKSRLVLIEIVLLLVLITGCVRKFTVIPQMKDYEFTVTETFGDVKYIPTVDARSDLDKKGKVESSCSGGKTGITHLGDKNYENALLPEFDKHLKTSLENAHLFSTVLPSESSSEATYIFSSSLEKYHVTLDEGKAQQTQACAGGGLLGAAIASSVDVTATTDIQLTGMLKEGDEEIWRHTITKQIIERDNYAKTKENAERSMGGAIGETCRDLITELAKYLASK